jgi:hypothetical protein
MSRVLVPMEPVEPRMTMFFMRGLAKKPSAVTRRRRSNPEPMADAEGYAYPLSRVT